MLIFPLTSEWIYCGLFCIASGEAESNEDLGLFNSAPRLRGVSEQKRKKLFDSLCYSVENQKIVAAFPPPP